MKRVGKQPVWQLLVVTTDVCGPFYRIVHFNVRRSYVCGPFYRIVHFNVRRSYEGIKYME